jgi:hypothetical protein
MVRGIVDNKQLRGQVCGVAMALCFLAGPVSLSMRLSANERGEPALFPALDLLSCEGQSLSPCLNTWD